MLWFVSIPLLDCIGLIFSRIVNGVNITSAGRDHIHHKLMNKYTPEGTLVIIIVISFISGMIGIFLDNNFETWVSTYLFILYSALYYLFAYRFSILKNKEVN